jgi:hypothetical protein
LTLSIFLCSQERSLFLIVLENISYRCLY